MSAPYDNDEAFDMPLDDPMFRTVEKLARRARKGDVEAAAPPAAASAAPAGPSKEEVRDALERKKLELAGKKLQHEERAHDTKLRDEQMKGFARATKEAEALRAQAEARQKQEEDTPEARQEALRLIGLMREELKTPGTGKRCTGDTPLVQLRTELGVMDQQANLERASDAPRNMLIWGIRVTETVVAPYSDFRGLAARFEAELERSKRAENPLDRQLHHAMVHASIKYSSWFNMGPEMFLGLAVMQMAREQMAANAQRSDAAAGAEADDEIARRFNELIDSDEE